MLTLPSHASRISTAPSLTLPFFLGVRERDSGPLSVLDLDVRVGLALVGRPERPYLKV
jgi:hypothetical protein